MMKKIIIASLCVLFSVGTFAQNPDQQELKPNESYLVGSLKDNWFFSVGVGAQTYLGENYTTGSLLGHISPAFDIAIGKWFTPVMGVRAQLSGFNARGYNDLSSPYVSGNPNDDGTYEMGFGYFNLHADFLFNLSAQLGRYNNERCYELIPFAGFGWAALLNDGIADNELAFSAGIINQFRVNDRLDINLELKGMLVNQRFDGTTGGFPLEGALGLTAGISYKFGGATEFVCCAPVETPIVEKAVSEQVVPINNADDQAKIDQLNKALAEQQKRTNDANNSLNQEKQKANKLQQEIDALKKQKANQEECSVGLKVFFGIGKATLDELNDSNLEYFANNIKHSNKRYSITGYADSKTGNKGVNEKLANKRAQYVYNQLTEKYGINKDLLTISSAVVDPKGNPALVRMAEVK